ncbi:hypothetical protein M2139_000437 [Enterococcus sp. PF1-24]|uniref:hypothetical protein n=1 Tax=unclassified Enterococcus TaxID=2608891 RepID=UPI002475FE2C|nr:MULTISPECIES: hypothetical protein [unclassified Enterococcus]MDH6363462.1 hypothetical protein [Enterococcus sp. PFB1-1]MDH6400556.1 hypothetical protein [Enterococcus sp. PF1-24]
MKLHLMPFIATIIVWLVIEALGLFINNPLPTEIIGTILLIGVGIFDIVLTLYTIVIGTKILAS